MSRIEAVRPFLAAKHPSLIPTEFHVTALELLCDVFDADPELLDVDWSQVVWNAPRGGSEFPLYRPELATCDPGTLTHLVLASHDRGVRVQLRTMRFDRLRLILTPRPMRGAGDPSQRIASMSSLLASWWRIGWPYDLSRAAFEADAHLTPAQRELDAVGRYRDATVWHWYRIWEMGVRHGQAAAYARSHLAHTTPTPGERA